MRFCHLITSVLALALIPALPGRALAQVADYQPDHVIVRFNHQASPEDADSLLQNPNVVGERSLSDGATILVALPEHLSVADALIEFSKLPTVEYVGPNYFCRFAENQQLSQAFLDATSGPFLEGTSPDKYFYQYAVGLTCMDSAHAVARGEGVLVASIDNGVDFAHPLFSAALTSSGYDFVDNDPDPSYEAGSFEGHGTFSSGILLLASPGITIVPIRALNGDGVGTTFDVTEAIDYAVSAGAQVVSLGFGMKVDDLVLRRAIVSAEDAQIIITAPAGNDSAASPIQYPAGYGSVVAVAALDSLDIKTSFSNYGTWVDVCAPGVAIYSALPGGDYWGRWDGTSFAAPIVAGMAAILRGIHPAAPAGTIRSLIGWGASPIETQNPGYMDSLGSGCIDFCSSVGTADAVHAVWGWVTDAQHVPVPAAIVGLEGVDGVVTTSLVTTNNEGFYSTATTPGTFSLIVATPGDSLPSTKTAPTLIDSDEKIDIMLTVPNPLCMPWGDLNGDGAVDVLDVVLVITTAFQGGSSPPGPEGCTALAGDADCDGVLSIVDVVSVIDVAFRGVDPGSIAGSACQ